MIRDQAHLAHLAYMTILRCRLPHTIYPAEYVRDAQWSILLGLRFNRGVQSMIRAWFIPDRHNMHGTYPEDRRRPEWRKVLHDSA